jgi:hypothetical protein
MTKFSLWHNTINYYIVFQRTNPVNHGTHITASIVFQSKIVHNNQNHLELKTYAWKRILAARDHHSVMMDDALLILIVCMVTYVLVELLG